MNKTNKIAFQGEYGANSDIACHDVFPDMEPFPCTTFEDTFKAVQSGIADLAMIPIENTLAGRVADIHYLLPRANLFIIGEYFLPIHFQLMVLKGVKREEIKAVCSHIHALGQCRQIIRKSAWKTIAVEDTAGAAKLIAHTGDRSMAALAPYLAAKLYGLDIIQENVEDSPDNTTRFIILSREKKGAENSQNEKEIITSLIFRICNVPAALYKALGGFATCGINLTKLESYQIEGDFQATQFYADIEGHPDNHLVKLALEELSFFSSELRIVGIYPASNFRLRREISSD
ncbi:MAG: prephenate dehydratase [Candidatus Tokpelaia sp. JSC188]|nr:MAG: prephenate dehydratase [Candidatus Tokpelaia sp. JSC188]